MFEVQHATTVAWHGFNHNRVNRAKYQIGKGASVAPDNRMGRRKQRNGAIEVCSFESYSTNRSWNSISSARFKPR